MFQALKDRLVAACSKTVSGIARLLSGSGAVDEELLQELTDVLIGADIGPREAKELVARLRDEVSSGAIASKEQLAQLLQQLLIQKFPNSAPGADPKILLLIGVNGTGKTSFSGKLAAFYAARGERVLLVAADTFRAAAPEQLAMWASRAHVDFHQGKPSQDPASVLFDGCKRFAEGGYDRIIVDTAGRVQTKEHLMRELEKLHRVVAKTLGEKPASWLVLDAMLGRNTLEQGRVFKDASHLDGIVLTKLDGSGKGGALYALVKELGVPVRYASIGEKIEDIVPFCPERYAKGVVNG